MNARLSHADGYFTDFEGKNVTLFRSQPHPDNKIKERTVPYPLDKTRQILPIFVFTAIFGLIFIIAPLFVRRGPNSSITRVCIMLSTVCCWIFWTTTYIVQMNPLLGPRLSNRSLAWIGHKWGKDAAVMNKISQNIISNATGAVSRADDRYGEVGDYPAYDTDGDNPWPEP